MNDAEFNRLGIMALLLLFNTGFGAVVWFSVSQSFSSVVPLIICSFATTIPNIFGLAQCPIKCVIYGNFVGANS